MKSSLGIVLILMSAVAACREADGPTLSGGGRVYVTSDPQGARIFLDNRDTGRLTPDTIAGLSGTHDFSVQLDTFQATYGFTGRLFVADPEVYTLVGPLVNRCGSVLCFSNQFRHYSVNRVRFASNPVGTMFLERGEGGNGLLWPSVTNNSYASGSMIGFAGVVHGADTVAIGIYDNAYLAGRPVPEIEQTPDQLDLRQTTWVLPSPSALNRPTIRGIEVSEHVIATSTTDDMVLLRLVFRNVTADSLYAALDPMAEIGGIVYDQVYIGFLFDPDVGDPGDDNLSYEPGLNLVYAYDSRFDESNFAGGYNRAPGLIGLQMVEAPEGSRIVLNGWTSQGVGSADWFAGQVSEKNGWYMLSGTRPYQPSHPDPRIGHLPASPGDVRLSVSAGPLRIVPGDSAAVTIAIMLAEPIPGSFVSGMDVASGDPLDNTRPLHSVATNLFDRARSSVSLAAAAAAKRRN